MQLLIGTTNEGKSAEMGRFLGSHFQTLSLLQVGKPLPEVLETGATLAENAVIKARAYFDWSGIPTVADDAGLEIDALNGEPGVASRRWPLEGEEFPYREKTDEEMIALALEKLRGIPWEQRTARLVMVGAFHDGERTLTASAAIAGHITYRQIVSHRKGYPFRSIFWVAQFGKVYEQLSDEEHEAVNHRREAYAKLSALIAREASS